MDATQMGLQFSPRLSAKSWTQHIKLIEATAVQRALKGKGMHIHYGVHETPIGPMFVACAGDDLLWIGFEKGSGVKGRGHDYSIAKCRKLWPLADIAENRKQTAAMARDVIAVWQGKTPTQPVRVYMQGTPFQISVWRSLMNIPTGHVVSYSTIATKIGKPTGMRAVGTAVGSNPVSLLIPCHRVVQATGNVENYGWGTPKKQQILREEVALAG